MTNHVNFIHACREQLSPLRLLAFTEMEEVERNYSDNKMSAISSAAAEREKKTLLIEIFAITAGDDKSYFIPMLVVQGWESKAFL